MSKLTLATRLADEIGTSVPHAKRFIDDVGADTASRLADDAAAASDESDQLISGGLRTRLRQAGLVAGAGGATVGTGALAWRQQDVWREQAQADESQAAAEQREAYGDAIRRIIESDLDPDVKRQLAEGAARTTTKAAGSGDGSGDGGLIPDDPQTLLILIIVMALVLKFALDSGVEVER